MSRSRKRTPIHGIADGSEKKDKKIWHSRMRAKEREAIHRGDEVFPDEKEVSNPWSMAKDGKRYWAFDENWDDDEKAYWKELMQK